MLGCMLMDMARIKLVNDGNTETEKNIKSVEICRTIFVENVRFMEDYIDKILVGWYWDE